MSKLVEYNPETNRYNYYVTEGNTLELTEHDARTLIRSFIEEGVSMTFPDTSYTAGELDATKQHLADLRRIVFEEKS